MSANDDEIEIIVGRYSRPIEEHRRLSASVDPTRQTTTTPRRLPKRLGKPYSIHLLILFQTFSLYFFCSLPGIYFWFFSTYFPVFPLPYGSSMLVGIIFMVVPVFVAAGFYLFISWFFDDLQEHYIRASKEATARALAEIREK